MPKIPGLQLRGQTYYLRLRVPTDIVKEYGQKEIVQTLGTKDYSEARKKIGQVRAGIESHFDELRVKLKTQQDEPDMLSKYTSELERLAFRWFNEQKQKDDKSSFEQNSYSQQDIDDALISLKIDQTLYDDEVKGISKSPEHFGMTPASVFLTNVELPLIQNLMHSGNSDN